MLKERRGDDRLAGRWNGSWKSGSVSEAEIDAIDADNQASGRICYHNARTGLLSVLDFHDDGPLERSYDPSEQSLSIVREALEMEPGLRHRQRLTLIDADTARFESTGNVGRANERTTTLTLRRGTHDDGCLRRIIPGRDAWRLSATEPGRTPGEPPGRAPKRLPRPDGPELLEHTATSQMRMLDARAARQRPAPRGYEGNVVELHRDIAADKRYRKNGVGTFHNRPAPRSTRARLARVVRGQGDNAVRDASPRCVQGTRHRRAGAVTGRSRASRARRPALHLERALRERLCDAASQRRPQHPPPRAQTARSNDIANLPWRAG